MPSHMLCNRRFIIAVLVVVVITYGVHDGVGSERALDADQRQATARVGQLHCGAARAFHHSNHFLLTRCVRPLSRIHLLFHHGADGIEELREEVESSAGFKRWAVTALWSRDSKYFSSCTHKSASAEAARRDCCWATCLA